MPHKDPPTDQAAGSGTVESAQAPPRVDLAFGVDIGGTGIKGAPVDLRTGRLATERIRIPTPHPATPDAVSATVAQLLEQANWTGDAGATFPAVIKQGVARTAANVDPAWIGTDVEATLGAATGRSFTVLNDADAAGVAEMAYGRGRDASGVVVLGTLGTGIGTAVFLHGQLLPNTELGHLEIDGHDAERRASDLVREKEDLSWERWAKRVTKYFRALENLLWPDLIIIGGGASKKADKFLHLLELRTEVVAAQLQNDAGIVGAALAATADQSRPGAGRSATVAS
jgi:polyphosphate glucokinase